MPRHAILTVASCQTAQRTSGRVTRKEREKETEPEGKRVTNVLLIIPSSQRQEARTVSYLNYSASIQ